MLATEFVEEECLHDTKRTRVSRGTLQGRTVVLKKFRIVDETSIQRFENEQTLLNLLSSSSVHVLRPLGSIRDAPVYGIVQPYFPLGSLGSLLHASKTRLFEPQASSEYAKGLSRSARICAVRDILSAVAHCHDQGVIIRDIKPENVLVGSNFICMLADFELGMTIEQSKMPPAEHRGGPASKPRLRFEGTPPYLAPEVILAFLQKRTTPATIASDMYSVGITLNEIASGELPYASARLRDDQWQQHTVIETRYSPNQFYNAVCTPPDPLRPSPPSNPDCCPAVAIVAELTRACWTHHADHRPNASSLLKKIEATAAVAGMDFSADARLKFAEEAFAVAAVTQYRAPNNMSISFNETKPTCSSDSRVEQPCTSDWRQLLMMVTEFGDQDTFVPHDSDTIFSAVNVAADGIIGRRENMEDRWIVETWYSGVEGIVGCYAAVDGHRGAGAAEFACAELPPRVRNGLMRALRDAIAKRASGDQKASIEGLASFGEGGEDWVAAELLKGFEECDAVWAGHQSTQPPSVQDLSGTCVVLALIIGRQLWVAWAGDCVALLSSERGVERLTTDHVPADPAERRRVEQGGGSVQADQDGRLRVGGTLQVTRALGDSWQIKGITATPDVRRVALKGGEDWLVLVTDGVTAALSPADVAQRLRDTLRGFARLGREVVQGTEGRGVAVSYQKAKPRNLTFIEKIPMKAPHLRWAGQVRHPEYGARRLCADAWEAGSPDNAAAVCCYFGRPSGR